MNYELKTVSSREAYEFMLDFTFPYHYPTDFSLWEESYLHDMDGEGRVLFRNLTSLGVFKDEKLMGYIQFGRTAFGFDERGEISDKVSYPVIRNLYFLKGQEQIGSILLKKAVEELSDDGQRIYAFFHYFGMSCFARHGKLFESYDYIGDFLLQNGFVIEHENVFYSSVLHDIPTSNIQLCWHPQTAGKCQVCDFVMGGNTVGGCEVHFLEQESIAYLRWIYINDNLCGKGIGTTCMRELSSHLYRNGIRVFDTDTALGNQIAQRYYEKNGFVRKGITRSYYITTKSLR